MIVKNVILIVAILVHVITEHYYQK